MNYIILYNSKSNSGNGLAKAKEIENVLDKSLLDFKDVNEIEDYDVFMQGIGDDSKVVLCGGDGTLNYYVNHVSENTLNIDFDYFATGTGNDFLKDINAKQGEIVENVNKYLKDLPVCKIDGKEYKFFNGVGYGIDGYCCEVGDELRKKSDKPVNYTGIAIKGILFHFKPVTATITVDGKEFVCEKSWLVPTMKGRFYGGGMMPAPAQDRNDPEKKVSIMTYQTGFGLKALIVFPNIFKGEHLKSKIVNVYTGNEIKVKFDRPCAAQIDGETVRNVTEYVVTTK